MGVAAGNPERLGRQSSPRRQVSASAAREAKPIFLEAYTRSAHQQRSRTTPVLLWTDLSSSVTLGAPSPCPLKHLWRCWSSATKICCFHPLVGLGGGATPLELSAPGNIVKASCFISSATRGAKGSARPAAAATTTGSTANPVCASGGSTAQHVSRQIGCRARQAKSVVSRTVQATDLGLTAQ